jgi:hypothetical protein
MMTNSFKNILEIQEEVGIYVSDVLHELERAGMSMGEGDRVSFPKLYRSGGRQTVCYDISHGNRAFQPNQDYGHYDVMGLYRSHGIDGEEVPTIILYSEVIEACAAEFVRIKYGLPEDSDAYKNQLELMIERMIVLVYTHEMMHWLIHRVLCAEGKPLQNPSCRKEDEIAYHEALAQAFMVYAFRESELMLELFHDLEAGQPLQYHLYKELGPDFKAIFNAFHFLRRDSLQSFEILKGAVLMGISRTSMEKESALWESLLKNPSPNVLATQAFPLITAVMEQRFPQLTIWYAARIGATRIGLI